MKKIISVAALLTVVFITACNKDTREVADPTIISGKITSISLQQFANPGYIRTDTITNPPSTRVSSTEDTLLDDIFSLPDVYFKLTQISVSSNGDFSAESIQDLSGTKISSF